VGRQFKLLVDRSLEHFQHQGRLDSTPRGRRGLALGRQACGQKPGGLNEVSSVHREFTLRLIIQITTVARTIVFRRLRWQATEHDGLPHRGFIPLAAEPCGFRA
jgi:hypothetical protein